MRQRQNVTLHEETIRLMKGYQEQHHIRYPGEALDRMVAEWEEQQFKDHSQEYVMGLMAQRFQEVFSDEMKRVKLAANQSDKNTQVLLELMNGFAMDQNLESCVTTPIFESQAMKDAKEAVEERISNQRQKRISTRESQASSS
ncbi:hypothetical protein MUO14_03475 [Halobacillus shinanisalinarum]|uniref:Uncharacterized protein n=1 Tax=Halobacillus shinanisalinarum TaxID=2932258 RepID=A0ABY4H100_9BACI|nr:hypothetical protein [Halobacillus shinanisalinarum]UOQ94043.1 hypothetical protein MUO14_03475 [Halobacillus shinanisalinarum]